MKYILDRIEGQYAVLECEDGKDLKILRSKLPEIINEGDVIKLEDGIYSIDSEETKDRKSKIIEKMKRLTKK